MGIIEEWMFLAQLHPVAATTTVFLLTITGLIFLWWHHPLYGKNVGPVVYPFIGIMPSGIKNKERIFDWMVDEMKKTPTHTMRLVRPGGVIIMNTANVSNVEYILKTRFENYPKGEGMQDLMGDLLGQGIFNADGNVWKLQRKLASHEFTTRSLREFMIDSAQKEVEERLVPILEKAAKEGTVIDLQDIFMRFAFDNICQLGFGVDPKCLEPSLPSVRFTEAFDTATECIARRFGLSPLLRKLQKYLNIGNEKKLKENLLLINEFAMGVIQARRKEFGEKGVDASGHQDLLSRFMRFTDSEDGDASRRSELEQNAWNDLEFQTGPQKKEGAADVFLRDIVISFVLAGRDTSSAALSWFFWLLSSHPQVEAKLYEEIEQNLQTQLQNGEDTARPGTNFSFEELKHLNYLHAALHEALRLYPPVPIDTKFVSQDDTLPDGTMVKKGGRVSYNIYAMGRMEDIWGPDCYEFKPERWLKDGMFLNESPYKFAVFQAGPRICLGKEMALIQMKLVAASLIYNFTFSVDSNHNPQYNRSLVMRMKHGLPMTVHPRRSL